MVRCLWMTMMTTVWITIDHHKWGWDSVCLWVVGGYLCTPLQLSGLRWIKNHWSLWHPLTSGVYWFRDELGAAYGQSIFSLTVVSVRWLRWLGVLELPGLTLRMTPRVLSLTGCQRCRGEEHPGLALAAVMLVWKKQPHPPNSRQRYVHKNDSFLCV